MNDPRNTLPDTPPSPERDTSLKGREEEVINQQEENKILNAESNEGVAKESLIKEQQYQEGIVKENLEGSDRTGSEEYDVPGSGV